MVEEDDKNSSEDGSYSDSLEIFDDIFSEGTAADVPDTKKGQPRPAVPPVKAAATTVKKAEQRPVSPKAPPAKNAAPPPQPIKKTPAIQPAKPKEKVPVVDSKDESFSESQELFDDIFSQRSDAAPTEAKKGQTRPAAPPVKAPAPKQVQKGPSLTEPIRKVEQRPVIPKLTPAKEGEPQTPAIKSERSFKPDTYLGKKPDRDKGSEKKEIEKIGTYKKPRKSLSPFVVVSSIIVLVILAILAGMFIEDRGGIIRGIKTSRDSRPEKEAAAGTDKDKDKDVKDNAVIEKKSEMKKPDIQISQQLKEEIPPAIDEASSVVPAPAPVKIIKNEVVKSLSYPYSIYLGSYNSIESVKKAKMDYEEIGLTPYWIKIDLGEKGTWFRLFAGYFQTREEADRSIKNKQIPNAESKKTNYVNLIGIYSSSEDVYRQKEVIEKSGYSPYVISDNKNVFRLYVGAFYQKEQAEEQNSDLLLKGIQSKVVER